MARVSGWLMDSSFVVTPPTAPPDDPAAATGVSD